MLEHSNLLISEVLLQLSVAAYLLAAQCAQAACRSAWGLQFCILRLRTNSKWLSRSLPSCRVVVAQGSCSVQLAMLQCSCDQHFQYRRM